jgi:hypothetical protein
VLGLAQQLRQPMIVLRPYDQVDGRLTANYLSPLRLGDAAGDDDHRLEAFGLTLLLDFARLAEFGKDLFRGPFADMAGVQDDKIGVLDLGRRPVALGCSDIAHALRIIDIHLTAE